MYVHQFYKPAESGLTGQYKWYIISNEKGIFCEIYIRGVSGSVIVVDSFSTICKK